MTHTHLRNDPKYFSRILLHLGASHEGYFYFFKYYYYYFFKILVAKKHQHIPEKAKQFQYRKRF